MKTKDHILHTAEHLIKLNGVNAFSYHDLSREIGVKTASIHYHFPSKSDLITAVILKCVSGTYNLIDTCSNRTPEDKLRAFFNIYKDLHRNEEVCLVGSLCTDINSLSENSKSELYKLSDIMLDWVDQILQEGKTTGVFSFEIDSRDKALMIISNMLASVQICRLTKNKADFEHISNNILKELKS